MKKWYKESYFDSNSWILENFEKLNISNDEALFILLIDFCKKNKKSVTYDYLTSKLQKNSKEIDKIISSLVGKHYLKLSTNAKGLVFDIDGIFEFDPEKYEVVENKDLYDTLADIFGKPLSQSDMQKTNDLVNDYGEKKFMQAVRIAEASRKVRMAYIEGILRNENKQ